MEVTTSEEIHILALFDTPSKALELQEIVYRNLPGENDPENFGMQIIVNAEDEVLGFNPKMLIGATTLGVDEIVNLIHELGGLAIAAHIDRESFSLIGQLGFVPDDLLLDALEISPRLTYREAFKRYNSSIPLIQSSDAHRLKEIGQCCTTFSIEEASIGEIRKAFSMVEGRKIVW